MAERAAAAVLVALMLRPPQHASIDFSDASKVEEATRVDNRFGTSAELDVRVQSYGWIGKNRLHVDGKVRNISDTTLTVPPLLLLVQDKSGKVVSQVSFDAWKSELGPDDETSFSRQMTASPDDFGRVEVQFAKAD